MQKKIGSIKVGTIEIGQDSPPFIIAEMSGNHNGDLNRALNLVDLAAESRAHAIKLQTYTADTMTLDLDTSQFTVTGELSLWKGETLYGLYEKAHTPWDWHEAIFKRAKEKGILCFSSPFDATAVDLLESLGAPIYKLASFEILDLPLVRKIASTGKPIIVSTGMSTVTEIEDCVHAAREAGCKELMLLKCASSYPADPIHSHINTIPHMRDLFGVHVGLSDHTLGIGVALGAVALGAPVVEKHFTDSRAKGGVDAAFSMEPTDLKNLVKESKRVWQALGEISYGPTPPEKDSLQFRRTLYVIRDMKAGDEFNLDNIRAIRPGFGIAPKYLEAFVGKRAESNITKGTPLSWDHLG